MREKGDLSLTDPHGWHWLSRGCPPWSLQEQWLCKKLPAAFLCSQWRYQGSLTHESRREKQTLISQLLSLPSMSKISPLLWSWVKHIWILTSLSEGLPKSNGYDASFNFWVVSRGFEPRSKLSRWVKVGWFRLGRYLPPVVCGGGVGRLAVPLLH